MIIEIPDPFEELSKRDPPTTQGQKGREPEKPQD